MNSNNTFLIRYQPQNIIMNNLFYPVKADHAKSLFSKQNFPSATCWKVLRQKQYSEHPFNRNQQNPKNKELKCEQYSFESISAANHYFDMFFFCPAIAETPNNKF